MGAPGSHLAVPCGAVTGSGQTGPPSMRDSAVDLFHLRSRAEVVTA